MKKKSLIVIGNGTVIFTKTKLCNLYFKPMKSNWKELTIYEKYVDSDPQLNLQWYQVNRSVLTKSKYLSFKSDFKGLKRFDKWKELYKNTHLNKKSITQK